MSPLEQLQAASPSGLEDRLDSWKVIAAYLGRGVRTVQRWERDEGLPVHRLAHEVSGGMLVALPGPDEDHNPATAGRLSPKSRRHS